MAPKRSASDKTPSSSSQPPLKKAGLKQREPSPSPEPPSRKFARNEPEDYPEPPEALFDAEIDLAATIATNAAALHGDIALETHLQQWRLYAETRLGEDQRVAVHVLAAFVEGDRAEGQRLTAGESSAARGSAGAAGPSDPLSARVKSIGELMGGLAGRGHDCLQVNPAAPRDVTAYRTLSVEDATLYVLNCYAEQKHSELRGRPGADVGAGASEGEGFGGALPMVWAEQLVKWEAEGVDARERHDRMRKTIERCLPGLPVFVMKNGGRYLSTSHLKYVLGMEKRAYELFRILREKNRDVAGPESDSSDSEDAEESDSDDAEKRSFEEAYGNRMLTAGEGGCPTDSRALLDPAPNKMVQALSTLAPKCSAEELAEVVIKSAKKRGDDICAVAKIALDQVAVLQGKEMGDQFRAASIRLMAKELDAAMDDGPPPEAFEEMEARGRAAKEARTVTQAALGTRARSPTRPEEGAAEKATADSKGKRVVDEQTSKPGQDESDADSESTAGGAEGNLEPGPDEGEYLDEPDPESEEETDIMTEDWEVMRDDRPGFNPSAPVPIKTLGEISRFWKEFGIPGQVVVMQRHYSHTLERRFHGSHNLWTFKVLSNIMPVSRFTKSAPSSETFVAFDLARQALKEFTEDRDFGRTPAIASLAHSEGVPLDEDMLHADGRDLLRMARGLRATGQGLGAAAASRSGAAAGPGTSEEGPHQQLRSTIARTNILNARAARANVAMAAVRAAKERLESGDT